MGEKRYTRPMAPSVSHAGWISPRDLRYSLITVGNSSFSVYWKFAERLNFKCSYLIHTQKNMLPMWGDGYVSLIMVISLQCIHTSGPHVYVHCDYAQLKYTQFLLVSYTSTKLGNEKGAKKGDLLPSSFPSSSVRFIILSLSFSTELCSF